MDHGFAFGHDSSLLRFSHGRVLVSVWKISGRGDAEEEVLKQEIAEEKKEQKDQITAECCMSWLENAAKARHTLNPQPLTLNPNP